MLRTVTPLRTESIEVNMLRALINQELSVFSISGNPHFRQSCSCIDTLLTLYKVFRILSLLILNWKILIQKLNYNYGFIVFFFDLVSMVVRTRFG